MNKTEFGSKLAFNSKPVLKTKTYFLKWSKADLELVLFIISF